MSILVAGLPASSEPELSYNPGFMNAIDALTPSTLAAQDAARVIDRHAYNFVVGLLNVQLSMGGLSGFIREHDLADTLAEIEEMATWGAEEDADDPSPNRQALAHASVWVIGLYQAIKDAGYSWIKPNVTLGSGGEVVLDWWNGPRALGVYISAQEAYFIQEWGANPETEMVDGDAVPFSNRVRVWKWLVQR